MQEKKSKEINRNLKDLGNVVAENYSYYKKNITPGILINIHGACLKWYNLYPPDTEITKVQILETREFIISEAAAGRLKLDGELGFVILHRAGDYLLLLITTWRNTNEMWESIYFKKAALPGGYSVMKFDSSHKGTYCVWELGVVWHERNAWVRFIESGRDEKAKSEYLNDVFSGAV
jgi:hypothetical protein